MKQCPKCGAQNEDTSNYCEYCGESLNESKSGFAEEVIKKDKIESPGQRRKSDKKLPFIMGGVMGGIAIIAILVLAMRFFPTSTPDDTNTDTTGQGQQKYNFGDESTENTEIEAKVLNIRDRYTQIVSDYNSGYYTEYTVRDGVTVCWNGDDIAIIMAKKGVDGYDYVRYLYYDDNELIFAYYEGEDSYRFYFDGEELMRIRYCEDSKNSNDAVNEDDPANFGEWPGDLAQHSDSFFEEAAVFKNYMELASGSYILPGSSSTYLTEADLYGLTKDECRIARNEIYARHGRMFDDEALQAYFANFKWYTPSVKAEDFKDSMLNAYELANLELIVEYEKKQGYR